MSVWLQRLSFTKPKTISQAQLRLSQKMLRESINPNQIRVCSRPINEPWRVLWSMVWLPTTKTPNPSQKGLVVHTYSILYVNTCKYQLDIPNTLLVSITGLEYCPLQYNDRCYQKMNVSYWKSIQFSQLHLKHIYLSSGWPANYSPLHASTELIRY